MPIDYAVALDGALVVEVWHGAINVDDLYDHREQQAQDPSIVNGARILADIRLATFRNISQGQMAAFARSYRATETQASPGPWPSLPARGSPRPRHTKRRHAVS